MLEKIVLNRKAGVPLYVQIKNQIKSMINDGTIPGGAFLLSTREMSELLDVSRTTILNAYNDLLAEDLISANVGRGTIVKKGRLVLEEKNGGYKLNIEECFNDASRLTQSSAIKEKIFFIDQENSISFAIGGPSLELMPFAELKRATDKIMREKGKTAFQQVDVEGYSPLREEIAKRMRRSGKPINPNEVLIVSGATQGLYLLTKAFINPGDFVIAEGPTCPTAIKIFQSAKARLIEIPVDENGMRTDILEKVLCREKPKIIYTLPTFQNPSGNTLSLVRRQKMLELAYRFGILIIEEDPYREIYFKKEPLPSLKSMDPYDHVIYLNTYSKVLSYGLRVGWIVASKQIIQKLSYMKQFMDLYTNSMGQYLVYEFLTGGHYEAYADKIREGYERKKNLMLKALLKYCSPFMSWNDPAGGFFLWCHLKNNMSSRNLFKAAMYEKVNFFGGEEFFAEGKGDEWIRLTYSSVDKNLIEPGIKKLRRAANYVMKRDWKDSTTPII